MRASAASRASFEAPTISLLTRMSGTPPQARASASATFWTHWPTAPRAICSFAMTADLWVLAWARSRAPVGASNPAMRSRLYSKASRSISRAGVSISSSRMPGWAGGGCNMGYPLWAIMSALADTKAITSLLQILTPEHNLLFGAARRDEFYVAFFIPDRLHSISGEMVRGLHESFLALGAFTILSTLIFSRLKAADGAEETQQKDIHLG